MRLSVICRIAHCLVFARVKSNGAISLSRPARARALRRIDIPLTITRRAFDTLLLRMGDSQCMTFANTTFIHWRARSLVMTSLVMAACALAAVTLMPRASAQDVPLISGGVGFVTSTNGGSTSYIPVVEPVLAAPIGNHLLVESRATILDQYSPKSGGQSGYKGDLFLGLSYLQADFLASPHATIVAGEFLTPFGTYNERLTPIWIGNFEAAPLIFGLGNMGTDVGVGGMVRGSAFSRSNVSGDYAVYFSATSTNQQFSAERSSGGRGSLYFPGSHLEVGASYGRLLQGTKENFSGTHVWWEPANSSFRFRSEYAHGPNSSGYWIEADYRRSRFNDGGLLGIVEPVFRMQQTFRAHPDSSDGLPSAPTVQPDFGLDFHFPHEIRFISSYSRQFSSTGNSNIWQTELVYRFLFPTWRGK
jgi:hypothetical protein